MTFDEVYAAYRATIYSRADENGAIYYYSREDFPGLMASEYSFDSSSGHRLVGCFYDYGKPLDGRVVLFEHGMGSGHRGYMREIELLARRGYRVFAYDHTGCMCSGGETTGGLVQSLVDLNDALSNLKRDENLRDCRFSVIGHSWGAYSTLNIPRFHPEVTHIVALSGYISVETMLRRLLCGEAVEFCDRIVESERAVSPRYFDCNALDSLRTADARALVIHSDDDQTVDCAANFEVMRNALCDRQNIIFKKVSGKRHNPNYTEDAVKYKDAFFAEYQSAIASGRLADAASRAKFRESYDWARMTAQDEELWATIFDFLEG